MSTTSEVLQEFPENNGQSENLSLSVEELIQATVRAVISETGKQSTPARGNTSLVHSSQTFQNKEISELLPVFDGQSDTVDVNSFLERLNAVQSAYGVSNSVMHLITVGKLAGVAKSWYHSKLCHISMDWDALKIELENYFSAKPQKLLLMKKFETRHWKRNEQFQDYFHEKVMLGNRMDMPEEDLIDYIIEGIDNYSLQNMARMKDFSSLQDLLRVMTNVTQNERGSYCYSKKVNVSRTTNEVTAATTSNAPVTSPPTRSNRAMVRCFNCNEKGHLSSQCSKPRRNRDNKEPIRVTRSEEPDSTTHLVESTNYPHMLQLQLSKFDFLLDIVGIFDTGSPVSLIKQSLIPIHLVHAQLDSCNYQGINSSKVKILGRFECKGTVKGVDLDFAFLIVPDDTMNHNCLIGRDCIETNKLVISLGPDFLKLERVDPSFTSDGILNIEYVSQNEQELDLSIGVNDDAAKAQLQQLFVKHYEQTVRPSMPVTNFKMKINVQSNHSHFFFRPRRMSYKDKESVNAIVKDLVERGIVRKSVSPYSSPVVLVSKRNGKPRMCVDYRTLNGITLRDNYPIPSIQDQLDKLQDFQDSSISSSTDKPLATISPEILPIQTIQIDLEQVAHSENYRVIDFEDEEELLSEPEPFGSGGSESEYLASDESRSSSIVPDTPENMLLSDTECDQVSRSLPVDHSEKFFSTDTDNLSSVVTSSINKTKTKELVQINCAKKTSNGKRIRNKDHSCYFCHKLLRNLARHFERAHSNETEVARILSMPKNSKRRREAFNALTRNGDFYHNCDVLLLKKGELILTRRPTEQEISSNALATLQSRKLNSVDLLPVTGDLIKLSKFLECMIKETKNDMNKERSFQNWSKLASFTLSRIILFNKRRSGEAARMKIEHYTRKPSWQSQGVQEMKDSLTEFETKLANTLTVVEIIGKRGRKVPVLLTKEMKESVDLLLVTRTAVGVPEENPFVFARLGDLNSYMRGHDCIKKWCSEANLGSPETITSTKLRKYVATVSQVFNLKENECDWLARHLGHDIRVHREFYRLHENTVELTKVSRLLLAVDQGKTHTFVGKSLEDIELKDLPPIEEDYPDQNDDEADDGETPTDSADVSSRSTTNDGRELTSEPLIGKKKQKSKNNKPKRTKREAALGRVPWSDSEKKVLLKKFKIEIKNEIVPGKDKCTKIKEEHNDVLSRRSWTDIKFFVKNVITRNKINKN